MKEYLKHHEWHIIEEGFLPENNKISESVFSIGNGRFGQRANFEEGYSGESLQGSYVAGVYYPDKTKVGWWKNGYPEYFAKVLNAPNWIGIDINLDGEKLDLAKCKVLEFRRVLDMQKGILERAFHVGISGGRELKVRALRFCSLADDEIGAIRYELTPVNFEGPITITPYIDADVENEDSNYEEKFWVEIEKDVYFRTGYVIAETKKTKFQVCTAMQFEIVQDGQVLDFNPYREQKEKYVGASVDVKAKEGEPIVIYKYASIISSLNYANDKLKEAANSALLRASTAGFDKLAEAHAQAWGAKWDEADILIEGDVAAQQGIRFNIFQLYQTYTGEDARLNIGPKGFTGEKYGGSTYWDTEAYCLPFYLATADSAVGRNLLIYRHKQLQKAIENAAKLGFTDGAALYPMVTMNGEECHNEWEITFEEIHRNGAIAYAIMDYIRYTGDKEYLVDYGLEVLIGIARFWNQRVHFSERRGMYVMHGVTGPNEYENNVNNNWYTNYIARWCLTYTLESLDYVKESAPEKFAALSDQIKFYEYSETAEWKKVISNMYLPHDEQLDVFVQHDGFLDKDVRPVSTLKASDRPLNQNWSWDRILRSCFIKQADTLQGLYFFEENFDLDTIRRNFEFYEPMTVHESSLSPCVHSIQAARLGMEEKAYEMYVRTARLDLDDYNNDTEDGCHITSMAGTWLALVKGFGGMRVEEEMLSFRPIIPGSWDRYAFKIVHQGKHIRIEVDQANACIQNDSAGTIKVTLYDKVYEIPGNEEIKASLQHA
ncbi:MAG: glycoside hydrolase family 65 protein [Saprospiraceae bacterium]|nr:glycoside hydrolase family 65 protein [Saprospiraceae bacterium]